VRKKVEIIFLSLLFSFSFLIWAKTFALDEENPHAFMDKSDKRHIFCSECHENDPNTVVSYLDVRLKQSVTASCLRGNEGIGGKSCHSREKLGRTHPTDVKPKEGMKIPEDLHLDENMQITCATCHDPHGDWTSPIAMVAREPKLVGSERYRSYFLRRTNVQSALCFACHTDK